MANVFLVEDDIRLSQLTADFLRNHDLNVRQFEDGTDLLAQVRNNRPDIVLLDVMLPGEDGFSLCRTLRREYDGPILFLTARDTNFDQVLGLELGADDYVIKPVEPRVLLARINALLRRVKKDAGSKNQDQLKFGKLRIDRASRKVSLDGEPIQLTSHEFDLLWMLAENASELVERERIYSDLIGREYDGLDRSADVRISRLRKKLNDNQKNPQRIKTIWGKGFFFVADAWD
ncbi:response regulator [Lacimicrobium alkaliphilum]|uniref:Two-component system response regulator n=1 Tax=Lacimicrobium alkaliphilum TaxID=1526571 RepID=A0A0U2ZNG7_9ALTE|nr:response regulator [Lacimicrobium alkaliphilum]ALS99836.1 two-component system response regulator [Lacimicrobium alkaliphilum]